VGIPQSLKFDGGKYPLASSTWDEEERQAILEVVDSGRFTMGEKVSSFETAFADYIGTRFAVMVNSGSSANLLMTAAYTLRYGKGIVVAPALGWSTSYAPFQQYGWKIVFVDIDSSLCINPTNTWRAVIDHETDVVLAINILGNSCDFNAFPRKVHVLEDNCEALGAEYDGSRTGSWGIMGTHSLYFAHHICTMEGGVITTDDEHLYQMLLCLRSHGWTRHLPVNNVLKAKVDSFEFIYPGYNVRPIEMMGAVGLKQLDKLPSIIEQRRENASRFPLRTQKEVGKSSWYGFSVYGDDVDRVKETCETRPVVTGNVTRSSMMKHFDYEIHGGLKYTDYVHDNACFIGNHSQKVDWSFL
jgi:CDP-4-dehydro-6-deoxyglucose reductase, E1